MESPDLIALRRMLGRAIKQARVQAQLSQAEVARRMNVPQSWVSNVETAVRRIDVVEAWMPTQHGWNRAKAIFAG